MYFHPVERQAKVARDDCELGLVPSGQEQWCSLIVLDQVWGNFGLPDVAEQEPFVAFS